MIRNGVYQGSPYQGIVVLIKDIDFLEFRPQFYFEKLCFDAKFKSFKFSDSLIGFRGRKDGFFDYKIRQKKFEKVILFLGTVKAV